MQPPLPHALPRAPSTSPLADPKHGHLSWSTPSSAPATLRTRDPDPELGVGAACVHQGGPEDRLQVPGTMELPAELRVTGHGQDHGVKGPGSWGVHVMEGPREADAEGAVVSTSVRVRREAASHGDPRGKSRRGPGRRPPPRPHARTRRAHRGCGRHRAPPRPGRRPAPRPVPAAWRVSFTKKQKPQHLCFPKHAKRAGETAAWPHRRGEPRAASVLGGRGPARTAQPLTPASQMPSPGSLSPSCRQSMKMTI